VSAGTSAPQLDKLQGRAQLFSDGSDGGPQHCCVHCPSYGDLDGIGNFALDTRKSESPYAAFHEWGSGAMSNTEKDIDSGRRGLLAGILAFGASTSLLALASQDWVDVKDPNELRALHSNKTFRGVGGDGVSWVAYYRSDGKALVVRTDYRFTRTWEVRENEVCYQDARWPGCRVFQRSKENPSAFRTSWSGHWAVFKVEDGVPDF
jgi:hypothetical protein